MQKFLLTTFTFKSIRPFHKFESAFGQFRSYSAKLQNNADSYKTKARWSDQETKKLLKLVEERGNKWTLFKSYFPGRSEAAIRQRYLQAKYNYDCWTLEERNIMQELLGRKENLENIDWEQVQESLPHKKSLSSIKRYYRDIMDPSVKRGKWTKEEIQELVDLVNLHGKDWRLIAEKMRTRNESQCCLKHRYLMTYSHGKFSKEEDKALVDAVDKLGTKSFLKIKEEINSKRAIEQLKARYYNNLDPALDKSPWTQEEKEQFFKLYAELKDVKLVKKKMNSRRSTTNLRNRLYFYKKQNKDATLVE